jgi:hypothetical protein
MDPSVPQLPRDGVETAYRQIQRLIRGSAESGFGAPGVSELFGDLYDACRDVLGMCESLELTTGIPNKRYVAFELDSRISRAVNADLFAEDVSTDWAMFVEALHARNVTALDAQTVTRLLYSVAISFCAVIDLTRSGDQKTPGTYFEWLVGHLFAAELGVAPTTRLPVLNLDMETTLPTDFTFDLGPGRPKFHLPVKTSTRERVIQVWAHQRVLDGVYGTGRFLGTPVILAETKTDRQTRNVVEICLPEQWRIYQMHIAQLRRIYYLDVPDAYVRLNEVFPPLHIRPFGEFFHEVAELAA